MPGAWRVADLIWVMFEVSRESKRFNLCNPLPLDDRLPFVVRA